MEAHSLITSPMAASCGGCQPYLLPDMGGLYSTIGDCVAFVEDVPALCTPLVPAVWVGTNGRRTSRLPIRAISCQDTHRAGDVGFESRFSDLRDLGLGPWD